MPCDASGKELDGCNEHPRGGRRYGLLKVLGEAAVAAQPSQRSLYDPAAGQDLKALCGIGKGGWTYTPWIVLLDPAVDRRGSGTPVET